jgi:hypothetical protein
MPEPLWSLSAAYPSQGVLTALMTLTALTALSVVARVWPRELSVIVRVPRSPLAAESDFNAQHAKERLHTTRRPARAPGFFGQPPLAFLKRILAPPRVSSGRSTRINAEGANNRALYHLLRRETQRFLTAKTRRW